MRCSTKYVGLDVHQATTLAVVHDGDGRIIARSILPAGEAALLEFCAGMRGAVNVAFEEDTQAQRLHDLLPPRVARAVVCNRRGSPGQGSKGDRVDAGGISDLLLLDNRSENEPSAAASSVAPEHARRPERRTCPQRTRNHGR